MKKRILVLLSVVVLMVVMLAMSVAPAFAAKAKFWECVNPTDPLELPTLVTSKFEKELFEARGYECTKLKPSKPPKPL
jgi:hypothetical protein